MKLFSFFNKEKNIPDQIYNNCNKHIIYSFVIGDISINQFYEMLYNDDAIFDYLQSIVDFISKNNIVPKRRTVLMKNVNQNKPFELRSHIEDVILKYRYSNKAIYCFDPTYCPTVKEYLKFCSPKTALGAFKIHSTIAGDDPPAWPPCERGLAPPLGGDWGIPIVNPSTTSWSPSL